MLWTVLRSPLLPFRVTTHPTVRKQQALATYAFCPIALIEPLVHGIPEARTAIEGARETGLARSANSVFLLQWAVCSLGLFPVGAAVYYLSLMFLQQRSRRLAKQAESRSYQLYGVDVSQSEYLTRPSVAAAVHFAEHAHQEQKRKTGEPYITHCIHTALILEDLVMTTMPDERREMAIICAVLHDVLDDTSVKYRDVQKEFGKQVAIMVNQISEISYLIQQLRRHRRKNKKGRTLSDQERVNEDRKLRTAILKKLEDPMILAVKLADRLHNLRTIYILRPEKQRAIAQETLKIFCNLAEGLGLFSLKAEMEDLCFCVLHPKEFWNVYQQVQLLWKSEKSKHGSSKSAPVPIVPEHEIRSPEMTQKHCKELLQLVTPFTSVSFKRPRSVLDAGFGLYFLQSCAKRLMQEVNTLSFGAGLDISVSGRVKSLFSTYEKMRKKGIPIEEVYDLLGIRVVVTEGEDPEIALEVCYKILNVVQHLWKQIPSELDDYIVTPKESGYQSIHVAVTGPGIPFEVQIRTASMDKRAEYGHASHWNYKEYSDADMSCSNPLTIRDAIWGQAGSIVGRPIVRIRDGVWRDGIVIDIEKEGLAIIVAVNVSERMSHCYGPYIYAVRKRYEELLNYVKERNWYLPRSGDLHAVVERYVLCGDRTYHLMDTFGHKHPTIVRPVQVFESDRSLAAHVENLVSGKHGNAAYMTDEDVEMKGRVNLLRSLYESPEGLNILEKSEAATVHILVMPEGRMHTFPRGTTAADVLVAYGHRDVLVNVNNQLVRANTQLNDGDVIVLQESIFN